MLHPGFNDTRDALHHAVQVPSAWAASRSSEGDVHDRASLAWDPDLGAWVGRTVEGLRAGLSPTLAQWFLARGEELLATRALRGATIDEGLAWLREAGRTAGLPDVALAPVGYPLPGHPVAQSAGGRLPALSEPALAEVARWFAVAHAALTDLAAAEPRAGEVRVWPHHFDIATLIPLDDDPSGEHGRAIGAGLSPGDAHSGSDAGDSEPYFYVNPYPPPPDPTQEPLPHGAWNTEGFCGAVLRASAWDGKDASLQAFLTGAVRAGRRLLGP